MSTIVGSLNNTYKLEEMGFTVPRRNGAATLDLGEIAFQDSMASLAAHYSLQLVGNRVVRQYQLLRGWPVGCCMFLSDDEDLQKTTMQLLKSDYTNFLALKEQVEKGLIKFPALLSKGLYWQF